MYPIIPAFCKKVQYIWNINNIRRCDSPLSNRISAADEWVFRQGSVTVFDLPRVFISELIYGILLVTGCTAIYSYYYFVIIFYFRVCFIHNRMLGNILAQLFWLTIYLCKKRNRKIKPDINLFANITKVVSPNYACFDEKTE